jgi:hypothetical protein
VYIGSPQAHQSDSVTENAAAPGIVLALVTATAFPSYGVRVKETFAELELTDAVILAV